MRPALAPAENFHVLSTVCPVSVSCGSQRSWRCRGCRQRPACPCHLRHRPSWPGTLREAPQTPPSLTHTARASAAPRLTWCRARGARRAPPARPSRRRWWRRPRTSWRAERARKPRRAGSTAWPGLPARGMDGWATALQSRPGSGAAPRSAWRAVPAGSPGMPRCLPFTFGSPLRSPPPTAAEPGTAVGPLAFHRCRHLQRLERFCPHKVSPQPEGHSPWGTARVPVAAGGPAAHAPSGQGGGRWDAAGSARRGLRVVPAACACTGVCKRAKNGLQCERAGALCSSPAGMRPWAYGNRVRNWAGPITESFMHLIHLGLSFQTHDVALICKSSLRFAFPHA